MTPQFCRAAGKGVIVSGFMPRLLAGAVVMALVVGPVAAPPAQGAIPAGPAAAGSSVAMASLYGTPLSDTPTDSSLSELALSNDTVSELAPDFDPDIHTYQVFGDDDSAVTIEPVPADEQADVEVSVGSVPYPLSGGSADVPLHRDRNDIVVTVISADSSTTTVYQVSVWRWSAPMPRVVGLADAHSTVYGGSKMTVTLADGGLPDDCEREYRFGSSWSGPSGARTVDPATGLTKETVGIPDSRDHVPGVVDVALVTTCSTDDGPEYRSETVVPDAVTYTEGWPVTSVDVPATVTSLSRITFHGTDVNEDAEDIEFWLEDAQGARTALRTPRWTGNNQVAAYVNFPYDDWYRGSGPRTVHTGPCPGKYESLGECTSTFSQDIDWVAPTVSDVSFTPSSGPVEGGTKIRVKGRFLRSGPEDLTVKVGDQTVAKKMKTVAQADDADTLTLLQGVDIVEFEAPPGAAPGPVPITVTNTLGTAVARGMFTYAARPVITSITPAAVAVTGGSVITVHGRNFGTAGRPTVVVGGAKSPMVTRISATKLTAVVPGVDDPAMVDVTVSSPQGGGISTAASLSLVAATTLPTISGQSVTSVRVGDQVTVTGTGFGATGTVGVNVGGAWATVSANTGTSVTFETPPHAAGTLGFTVAPTHSALSATRAAGVNYVAPVTGLPNIARIASVVDYSHQDRNDFDPVDDLSDEFTITGTNLAGTSSAATRVFVGTGGDGVGFTVVPTSVTATSVVFAAPRGFTDSDWQAVRVITDLGSSYLAHGIQYLRAGRQITASPDSGLCLRTGTGSYTPVSVALYSQHGAFYEEGSITVDGVLVTTASYTDSDIVFSMADLASDLTDPWGTKRIVITPADTTKPAQSVYFSCAVTPAVTTTADGFTDPLTIAAGTAYTLGTVATGFIGDTPFSVTAPGGYEYVTVADENGFFGDVHAGAPVAAGDYYVRVALSRATYASERYLPFTPVPVRITITGTPVTITAVSAHGATSRTRARSVTAPEAPRTTSATRPPPPSTTRSPTSSGSTVTRPAPPRTTPTDGPTVCRPAWHGPDRTVPATTPPRRAGRCGSSPSR